MQERVAQLIESNNNAGKHKHKLCFGIAGGGGTIISTIAATSGASSLLLEGTLTYDRTSYQTYVRKNSSSGSGSGSGSFIEDDGDGRNNHRNKKKKFSYSSMNAARLASMSSLWRGLELMSEEDPRSVVGIGAASTLQTYTEGARSKTGRPSFGNIVVTLSTGKQVQTRFTLPNAPRFQQDLMVSHLICHTIEQLLMITGVDNNNNMNTAAQQQQQQQLMTRKTTTMIYL